MTCLAHMAVSQEDRDDKEMNSKQDQPSHLFLVRFWSEQVSDKKEWRGRIQHVLSGEAHTFDDWSVLRDLLQKMAETEWAEVGVPDGKAKETF
jgi:hypothetical protein